jgi:SAM-dependent methyltransferase
VEEDRPSVDYAATNVGQLASESDDFTAERYRQFARHLPPGRPRVLDVGCGVGRGGVALKTARPEAELTGLDCVAERIERLPEGVYVHAAVGDAGTLPFDDGAFDAVVAGEFVEHLAPADVDQVLLALRRVLRPGGVLLLTTPNPDGLRWRLRGVSPGDDPSHLSVHSRRELVARLRRLGFTGLRVRGSGRVTRFIGDRVPILPLYQSYLVVALRR